MTTTIESEIRSTVARFYRDQQGREPGKIETFVLGEMIVVRCHDVFTHTERDLAKNPDGKKLIQSARRDLRALTRREIEREISKVIGRGILRSFYDIDTRNGEQVEVYILDRPL